VADVLAAVETHNAMQQSRDPTPAAAGAQRPLMMEELVTNAVSTKAKKGNVFAFFSRTKERAPSPVTSPRDGVVVVADTRRLRQRAGDEPTK